MSRTEKLRRLARRLRIESNRLIALASHMEEIKYPMCASDVRRYGVSLSILSQNVNWFADNARDKRGAQRRSASETGDLK